MRARPIGRRGEDSHRQRQQRSTVRKESIDDYMGRLMQRVRSKAGEPGRATYTPPRRARNRPPIAGGRCNGSLVDRAAGSSHCPRPPHEAGRDVAADGGPGKTHRSIGIAGTGQSLGPHGHQPTLPKTARQHHAIQAGHGPGGVGRRRRAVLDVEAVRGRADDVLLLVAAVLVAIYWGVQYALLTGRLGSTSRATSISTGTAPRSVSPPRHPSRMSRQRFPNPAAHATPVESGTEPSPKSLPAMSRGGASGSGPLAADGTSTLSAPGSRCASPLHSGSRAS